MTTTQQATFFPDAPTKKREEPTPEYPPADLPYTHPGPVAEDVGRAIGIARGKRSTEATYSAARRFGLYWDCARQKFVVIPRKPRDWDMSWSEEIPKTWIFLRDLPSRDVLEGPTRKMWQELLCRIAARLEVEGLVIWTRKEKS